MEITPPSDNTRQSSSAFLNTLLKWMVDNKGSDLFITAGIAPCVKVSGTMTPIPGYPKLSPEQTMAITTSVMNGHQYHEFKGTKECNFALSLTGLGRFRVNAMIQRASAAMVIRVIPTVIPTLDSIGAPPILGDIIMAKRGLVVMVGATGSGKSTTLAAMIDHRNSNSYGHIITLEDPIEFTHNHKNCVITQREIGVDSESWDVALKNTLRQAPDVIFMGEIRDRDTMEYALQFAETGHLCIATLHANNANQAIDRVLNFFPEERKPQTLMDMAMNLRAFVSQRLIPKIGGGRVPAIEILLNTPIVSEKILKGETAVIKEIMKKSREAGMITFDDCLFELYKQKLITFEDGFRNADSGNEFRLKAKLADPTNEDVAGKDAVAFEIKK